MLTRFFLLTYINLSRQEEAAQNGTQSQESIQPNNATINGSSSFFKGIPRKIADAYSYVNQGQKDEKLNESIKMDPIVTFINMSVFVFSILILASFCFYIMLHIEKKDPFSNKKKKSLQFFFASSLAFSLFAASFRDYVFTPSAILGINNLHISHIITILTLVLISRRAKFIFQMVTLRRTIVLTAISFFWIVCLFLFSFDTATAWANFCSASGYKAGFYEIWNVFTVGDVNLLDSLLIQTIFNCLFFATIRDKPINMPIQKTQVDAKSLTSIAMNIPINIMEVSDGNKDPVPISTPGSGHVNSAEDPTGNGIQVTHFSKQVRYVNGELVEDKTIYQDSEGKTVQQITKMSENINGIDPNCWEKKMQEASELRNAYKQEGKPFIEITYF